MTDAQWIRKELANSPGVDGVRVKRTDDDGESKWIRVPVQLWREMLAVVRDEGQPKPLPVTFGGHEIVMSARIPYAPGRPKHRAVVVHHDADADDYTVHYLNAQDDYEPWGGWMGEYNLTRDQAFTEFARRLASENVISK